jgi:alpha-glucoside transport system permease protein
VEACGDVVTKRRNPVAVLIVTVIAVIWTVPTVGLLVTSFRPRWEVHYSGWWTVIQNPVLTLENYRTVLTGGDVLPDGISPYLFNSLAIAVPATVFPIILGAMVAYAITALHFRGSLALLIVIVALQVIPLQMTLLPLLELFNIGWSIGPIPIVPNLVDPQTGRSLLAGRYITLWIVHTMFALPLCIFIFYSFGRRLSRDVIDAAQLDGASHFLIFRRLYLPLMSPALATFAIFQFLWVWNDLLIAITFVGGSSNVAPITAYVAYLKGGFSQNEHLLTAAAFIAMVIPLIVFFALQRYYARGFVPSAYVRDRST